MSVTDPALLGPLPVNLVELEVYNANRSPADLSRFKHMKRLQQHNWQNDVPSCRRWPPALEVLVISALPLPDIYLPQSLLSVKLSLVYGLEEFNELLALPALRHLCIHRLEDVPGMPTIKLPPLDTFV